MRLIIQRGPGTGREFPVAKPVVTLGRAPSNDVVVDDDEVSRQHAVLRRQDGGYVIADMGSSNGTFVNGKRITAPQPLRVGDTIRIGRADLVLQAGAARGAPATTVPWPLLAALGGLAVIIIVVAALASSRPLPLVVLPTPTLTPTPTPTPTPSARLYGYVWEDADEDGVRDGNESGLSGVQVALLVGDEVRRRTATRLGGYWEMLNVPGGDYTVAGEIPGGFKSTTLNPRAVTTADTGSFGPYDFGLGSIVIVEPLADCPNRGVRITWPRVHSTVAPEVSVFGSANIKDFDYYKLEIGPGPSPLDSEWVWLMTRHGPLESGVLGRINLTRFSPGEYTLRLVVVDESGNYPTPCAVPIWVSG